MCVLEPVDHGGGERGRELRLFSLVDGSYDERGLLSGSTRKTDRLSCEVRTRDEYTSYVRQASGCLWPVERRGMPIRYECPSSR